MRTCLSLGLASMIAACAMGDDGARAGLPLSVDSPSGVGSGEPFLSPTVDGVVLSWLEEDPEGGHGLWMARLDAQGWGPRRAIAQGRPFFVNWADFPSVVTDAHGALWAHWLEREEGEGLAYGIRVTRSADGGASWSEPWTPHEDGTPTEHGFVSLFPFEEGVGLAWLDGRRYAEGPDGSAPTREMTVRFRSAVEGGPTRPESLVDARACDCCQTDVAVTSRGPVMVYRDRTENEVRDIYLTRWDGTAWSGPRAVHDDGWVIGGCPVNGPAVAADGERVAVAWFTAAGDVPKVHVAFSSDAGDSFGAPVRVDGGNPAGRVDLLLAEDGAAVVSWLERTGGDGAEVRVRRVGADATPGAEIAVTGSSAARASGFPRIAPLPWEPTSMLVAWTDVSAEGGPQVKVARMEVPSR